MLEKRKILDLKKRLGQWQEPIAMHDSVKEVMVSIGDKVLFGQPGLAFLRDSWIAAEFSIARKAKKVRLVSDDWPDFELYMNGKTEQFEAVEADDPLRHRGDEYRNDACGIKASVGDWSSRADQAPNWIERVCEKKKNKRYGSSNDVNLIIYLNLNEFGIRHEMVKDCFASSTKIAKDDFKSVWILWKLTAYPVWGIPDSAV